MLSLTRYPDQKIIVTHEPSGDVLTIAIESVTPRNKQVRVGIDGDSCFLIDREEVHKEKRDRGGNR